MTLVADRLVDDEPERRPAGARSDGAAVLHEAAPVGPAPEPPVSSGRVAVLAWLWLAVTASCLALVLYGMEPLFQQREQRQLIQQETDAISRAANEAGGLPGISVPTKSPNVGAPVAILEIGRLQLQQAVVEGVQPVQTAAGPGHVPGTAGLGQPGNSVVVGRSSLFGGPFGGLDALAEGDQIVVSTTQGPSVYRVRSVRTQRVTDAPAEAAATGGGASVGVPDEAPADPTAGEEVALDALYGPTTDDRLTLVTSASALPFNSSEAVVVTAALEGRPYRPTPQGGRTDDDTGRAGDAAAGAAVLLALLAFGGAAAATIALYRRTSGRTAYLLTAAPLLVAAILLAESLARLLPAWS